MHHPMESGNGLGRRCVCNHFHRAHKGERCTYRAFGITCRCTRFAPAGDQVGGDDELLALLSRGGGSGR